VDVAGEGLATIWWERRGLEKKKKDREMCRTLRNKVNGRAKVSATERRKTT